MGLEFLSFFRVICCQRNDRSLFSNDSFLSILIEFSFTRILFSSNEICRCFWLRLMFSSTRTCISIRAHVNIDILANHNWFNRLRNETDGMFNTRERERSPFSSQDEQRFKPIWLSMLDLQQCRRDGKKGMKDYSNLIMLLWVYWTEI